ncbi:YggS family pyridoxal phosphate-dependent enzyme [Methylobacterium nodulans]|uniref:Pyridoxal phosphate homeostasis protein n=1 Tax=Methylobacterium nodulans (strain LMG 21967 / CNCM I-2342 / ORS 2060) TaxID=460265 RepID=B8IHZ1_METNO|nr:YggS family pyridoxal phosphate-dependent enzyme [Methylobacterium nodulans]ACL56029.1 alanine racemase domain protein [Methylobacterium nodulans ORS 2060]
MIEPAAVAANLAAVRAEIARAALDHERDPASIALIAVSKTVPGEGILPALEAGQRLFGENYVQEAKAKWPLLRERYPDVELHMIGPLQSNKAREAVELFDVIHSLDRPSLAAALAKEMQRTGRRPRLLVQVNTGDEPQKGGVSPAEVDAFLAACRDTHGLTIAGLMCIPPAADPPSPHFALLARIAARHGLGLLSMGMSSDFAAAIQMGATHVRVGTAIFGARASKG